MFLDQRRDAHQALKLVEVAIDSFHLLNAMYAAVHLLMLVATVTGLWAAVNAVIGAPMRFMSSTAPHRGQATLHIPLWCLS